MFKKFKLFFMLEGADEDIQVVDPFDAEGLKKALDTTTAQKKIWREKAVDPTTGKTFKELYEAKVAAAVKPPEPAAPAPKPGEGEGRGNNAQTQEPDTDWLLDNLDAFAALQPDERTALRKEAKDLGVDPMKYIKSTGGQAHLKEIRSTTKSNGSTPTVSNNVPTFKGKPVRDVITDEKASPADKQAAYEARMKGTRGVNQSE